MKSSFVFSFLFILSLCAFPPPLSAQQLQTVVLKDGTVLKGEVAAEVNGKYYIRTPHLGTVTVEKEDLSHIGTASPTQPVLSDPEAAPAIPAEMLPHVQRVQQEMDDNPQFRSGITDLLNDPEIQKILMDPQLMQTLTSMDPEKMRNDPKVQQLLNNPKIQQLIQVLRESTLKK